MRYATFVFALTLLLLWQGTPVFAEEGGLDAKVDRLFEKYDADGDGKISEEELGDASTFQALDKDGDGIISRKDFGARGDSEGHGDRPEGHGEPPEGHGDRPEGHGEPPEGHGDRPDRSRQEGDMPPPREEDRPKGDRPGGEGGPDRGRAFMEMDADGDSQVSEEEFVEFQRRMFQRFDQDQDGRLTQEEMRKGFGGMGKRREEGGSGAGERGRERFKQMDSDADGSVSREEWKGPAEMFDRLDKDGDGFIRENEIGEGMSRGDRKQGGSEGGRQPGATKDPFGPPPDEGKDRPDEPREPKEEGGEQGNQPRRPAPDPARLFGQMDRDGDGFLSGDEVPAGRMQSLDTDGDGKVSEDEFRNAPVYKRPGGQ